MANCVIAYNPCFSCDEKKCEICELDMHRKRVFQQSEGEWKKEFKYSQGWLDIYTLTCPECGTQVEYITKGDIKRHKYCSVCGLKMKGGAE
jgi:transcription elongation factor Elf1